MLGAGAALLGALIGGLVTLTVQRRALQLQQRAIEIQRGTLELQQQQAAVAATRRWDDTRRALCSDYLALVARFRREVIGLVDDHATGRGVDPDATRTRLREVRAETSASYNTVRLVSSKSLEAAARQLLIDVIWYVDELEGVLDRSAPFPPDEALERIRDKYEQDAPAFVTAAQRDLGLLV